MDREGGRERKGEGERKEGKGRGYHMTEDLLMFWHWKESKQPMIGVAMAKFATF